MRAAVILRQKGLWPEIFFEGFFISHIVLDHGDVKYTLSGRPEGSRTLKELPEFNNIICGRSILSYGVSSRSQPFTYNVIQSMRQTRRYRPNFVLSGSHREQNRRDYKKLPVWLIIHDRGDRQEYICYFWRYINYLLISGDRSTLKNGRRKS